MAYVDRDRLAYFLSKLKVWVQDNAASKNLATPYADGLMSATDKAKLDGSVVDAALSSVSANPVQNRAIAAAVQSLGDRMTAVEQQASSAFKFKGSVPTKNDLPSTGNQTGDMWTVEQAPDAGNWAWDGTMWVKTSDVVDLSNYATKDVATQLANGLMSSADKQALDSLMQGFVPSWSDSAVYAASMLVKGSDGNLYYSQAPSGSGTAAGVRNPVSSPDYWTKVSSSDAALVHLAGAETVTGQKTFTQTILGNARTASALRAWNVADAYAAGDVVYHGDALWLAVQASSSDNSKEPGAFGSDAYWSKIAFDGSISGNAGTASGLRAWDSGENYAPGETVRGSDGQLYTAALASGPGSPSGAKTPGASGSEAYWKPVAPASAVQHSLSRASDVLENGVFDVPAYVVGSGSLLVWLDGVLCVPGESYAETGTAGQTSYQIQFLQRVPASMAVSVRVN